MNSSESRELDHQSELEALKDLLRIAPAFFGFLSPTGKILNLNDPAAQAIGARREDLLGKYFWECDWWTPLSGSAQKVKEVFELASSQEESKSDLQYWALTPQGEEVRWMCLQIRAMRDTNGQIARFAVTGIDVTERVANAEASERSKEHFQTLADSIPQLVWITDSSGVAEYFNQGWIDFTGVDENSKYSWASVVHPEDAERSQWLWEKSVASATLFECEYRLKNHRTGKYRWFRVQGRPKKDLSRNTIRWYGTCTDIEDKKTAQLEYERNVDSSPSMLWTCDRNGQCTYLSRQWLEFTGQTPSEGLGQNWLEKLHPLDRTRARDEFFKALETQCAFRISARLQTQNGAYRWIIHAGNPLFDLAGKFQGFAGSVLDVHEQKMAIEQRDESDRNLSFALESAKMATWTLDLRTQKLEASPQLSTILGFPSETTELESVIRLGIHPEDQEKVFRQIQAAIESRSSYQNEYRRIDEQGNIRWFTSRGKVIENELGEAIKVTGITREITDQKLSQATLARNARLVESMPLPFFAMDANWKVNYWNPAAATNIGLTKDEALGRNLWELFPSLQKSEFGASYRQAFEEQIRTTVEAYYPDFQKWFQTTAFPFDSGVAVAFVDTTERKRIEEDLRELQQRFTRVASATDLGIFYCDLPFDELLWNKEMRNHFFMPESTRVTIHHFYAHMHPDDRARTARAIDESIQKKAPYDIYYRTMNPDDSSQIKWIRSIGWTDSDAQGMPTRFDGITLDATAEFLRQDELKQAKEEAERANELKSNFLANMSHEIRTPMSAVLGFTEILRDFDLSEADRLDAITRIDSSGRALLSLIDDILDISKIEAGKIQMQRVRFSPLEVASDVMKLLRITAEQKGIALKLKISPSLPATMFSDPDRIRQILVNLVGNAIKFTPSGEVVVNVQVEGQRFLILDVQDTGIGISEEDQRKLFQPFTQADSSIARSFGGTGLGLILSRRLCEQLGGSLTLAESHVGRGSRFQAKIDGSPFGESLARVLPTEQPSSFDSKRNERSLSQVRILLAEDVLDNQVLMRTYIESAGGEMDVVSTGCDAIERALGSDYDIVLMDLQMPVVDGIRATQVLRSQGYQKPIIALTAHAMKEEIERSLKAGCNAHLNKPITKSGLILALQPFLRPT